MLIGREPFSIRGHIHWSDIRDHATQACAANLYFGRKWKCELYRCLVCTIFAFWIYLWAICDRPKGVWYVGKRLFLKLLSEFMFELGNFIVRNYM